MTNEERFEKYIEEHCKNCMNRKTDLCEIRISVLNDIVTTRCVYYEKIGGRKKKQPAQWQKW